MTELVVTVLTWSVLVQAIMTVWLVKQVSKLKARMDHERQPGPETPSEQHAQYRTWFESFRDDAG